MVSVRATGGSWSYRLGTVSEVFGKFCIPLAQVVFLASRTEPALPARPLGAARQPGIDLQRGPVQGMDAASRLIKKKKNKKKIKKK